VDKCALSEHVEMGHIIYCLNYSLVNALHRRMRAVLQTKSSSTEVREDALNGPRPKTMA
jgi:hypothetical protein